MPRPIAAIMRESVERSSRRLAGWYLGAVRLAGKRMRLLKDVGSTSSVASNASFFAKENLLKHLSFLSLVALRLYVFFQHEMWRDETHVILIARDLPSFGELMHWQAYDRGPALWTGLLYGLKQLGLDPAQAGPAIIVVSSILLLGIVFYGLPRIPLIFRVLLGSSYILMYEYTVFARPYPLTALLLGIFIMLELRSQRHFIWKAVVLLFLALCGNVGLIAAIAMAVYLFAKGSVERLRTKVVAAGIFAVGVALAILSALPPPDFVEQPWLYDYRDQMLDYGGIPRLLETSARILLTGFLYIPAITLQHWWDPTSPTEPASFLSNTLSYHPALTYFIGLTAIALGLWVLRRLWRISIPVGLAAAALWGAYLLGFSYLAPGLVRHFGIVVLGTLALFALARSINTRFSLRWMTIIAGVVLVIQSVSGSWAVYAEQRDVFSQAKVAASWLQANYPEETPAVYPDHMGATLSLYTGRSYYSLSAGKEVTFIRETEEFLKPFSAEMINRNNLKGESPLLITHFPYHALLDGGRIAVEPLKSFQPSVATNEDYYVHRVRFRDEQTEESMWTFKLLPFEGQSWIETSARVYHDSRFDNSTGSTVELRAKFLKTPRADFHGAYLSLQDGTREGKLSFFQDRIEIRDHQNHLWGVHFMDTGDDFHTYRMAMVNDTLNVYVDGHKVGFAFLSWPVLQPSKILFGDFSAKSRGNMEAQVEYLDYHVGGALTPAGDRVTEDIGIWTELTDMDVLPDMPLSSHWTCEGTFAVKSVAGGVLTLETRGHQATGNLVQEVPQFSNTAGSTAEVKMRLLEAPTTGFQGMMFSLIDGKREGKISFHPDQIKIRDQNDVVAIYPMDTGDDFHTYRMALVKDTLEVYVDGERVASALLSREVTAKRILFGDFSPEVGENMIAQVDYLAYSVEGAVTPEGTAVTSIEERLREQMGMWTSFKLPFAVQTVGTETEAFGYDDEKLDNTVGSTAEVKMRLLEAPVTGFQGAMFSLTDGKREGKISFYPDQIKIRDHNNVVAIYPVDTGDAFHTYRMALVKDTLEVYVDGEKVACAVLSREVTAKRILFGDSSPEVGENVTAQVEYLAHSVKGAVTPEGTEVTPLRIWTSFKWHFALETVGTETEPFVYNEEKLDNTVGSTAEVKMKLLEAPATGFQGMMFSLIDGKREGKISFHPDQIKIRDQNDVVAIYPMDTGDDFHTYRMALVKDTLEVYVDDEKVACAVLSREVTAKRILFGDSSPEVGENVTAQVEYLAYSVKGAVTPEGTPVTPLEERMGMWTKFKWRFDIKTIETETEAFAYDDEELDNSVGSTAEVKMKLVEAPDTGFQGMMFSLIDGKREGKISFYPDSIKIRDQNDVVAIYPMDTGDDFHTYTIALVKDTLEVYVDGERVASAVLSREVTAKRILFGDFSPEVGENVTAQVEYLAYSVEGAKAPQPSTQ